MKSNLVDQFIADAPAEARQKMQEIRALIQQAVPEAEETINYGIPTYKLGGNLVHFSGYKNHIGFYPGASGIAQFQSELSKYKGAKGSVQFPLDKPLPIALIKKIIAFRVKENLAKSIKKGTLKTCAAGHQFYKSSDCPTCPECEKLRKPASGLLSELSAPARRALENAGITTEKLLAKRTEAEITAMHGIGPNALMKLKSALKKAGLSFKK